MTLNNTPAFNLNKSNSIKIVAVILLLINFKFMHDLYFGQGWANSLFLDDTGAKANVKVFDLNQPLAPADLYELIECVQSAEFFATIVTVCLHNINVDTVVCILFGFFVFLARVIQKLNFVH